MNIKSKQLGFTLVELLVVIAIIGVLATLIVIQLGNARAKARNSKQMSDLRQLRVALELYFGENGSYPTRGFGYQGEASSFGSLGYDAAGYIPNLVPDYITKLPENPNKNKRVNSVANCSDAGSSGYIYTSDAAGTSYKVLANCTPERTWTAAHPFYDPGRPAFAWTVCSPSVCSSW